MSGASIGVVDFDEALEIVLSHAHNLPLPETEQLPLLECLDRVLAEAV